MNGSGGTFLQAVRGPILLIALGSLAAMDNFLGVDFTKTWPALLILGGLLKLLERMSFRPPEPPAQVFPGGGA
jgi:hypothetical protein